MQLLRLSNLIYDPTKYNSIIITFAHVGEKYST